MEINQVLRKMVTITAEYQQELANTQSVLQSTTSELRAVDNAARRAGETTLFTASQAASALYYMASAGLTATESIQALDGTLAMAQATGKGLSVVAEMMNVTLAQFSLKATESTRVANTLTAGIVSSQATLDKYKTSMAQVGPVAEATGHSLEEVVALLNNMYDSGMQASRAGRAMRNGLAELASESSATSKKLSKMGIDFKDIDVAGNSLVDVFSNLSDANLSAGEIMKAFGKVIGPQMQILIRSSREELEKYQNDVTDTNKAFKAAHIQLDTLHSDYTILKSATEALAITLVTAITPAMRSVIQLGISFIRGFNKVIKAVQGARSSADIFSESITALKTASAEYARIQVELTTNVENLTTAEKALYEIQSRRIILDLRKDLQDLSNDYDKAIEKTEKMTKINKAAELGQEYASIVTSITALMSAQGDTRHTEAQEAELESLIATLKTTQDAYKEANEEINGFGYTAGMGTSIRNTYAKVKADVSLLDGVVKQLMSHSEDGVQALLEYGTEVGSSYKDVSNEVLNITGRISESALDSETSLASMIDATKISVAVAGQLYSEGMLTDKQLLGVRKELVDMIKAEAEAYTKKKNAVDEVIEGEYEAIDALRSQITASTDVSSSLNTATESLLSTAQASGRTSQSAVVLAKTFDSLLGSLHTNADALAEQVNLTREANLLLVDENMHVGEASKVLLKKIANTQADVELRRISILLAQNEARLLVERNRASEDFTIAEGERLDTLIKGYETQLQGLDEWKNKYIDAERDMREARIDSAYEEAHTALAFKQILAKKRIMVEENKQVAIGELEEEKKKTIDAQKEASEATIKGYVTERTEKLRIQEDFYTAEQNIAEASKQKAQSLAELARAESLAYAESVYAKDLEDNKGNAVELALVEERYLTDKKLANDTYRTSFNGASTTWSKTLIANAKRNNKVLEDLNKEHNDKVTAEQSRFTAWATAINTKYYDEEQQLLAYYQIQLEKADDAHKALWEKEIERQTAVIEKWAELNELSQAYIDMLAKQTLATREARIQEMLTVGDIEGATDMYLELSRAKEKADNDALDAKYKATREEIGLAELSVEKEQERLDKLAGLKTAYEVAQTAITTFYSNERDAVSEEYTENEEERIKKLADAWLTLTSSFDKYTDALKTAQNDEEEVAFETAIGTGEFVKAKEIRDKLREEEKQADIDNAGETLRVAVASKQEELDKKKITQKEFTDYVEKLEGLHTIALDKIDEVYLSKARLDALTLAEEQKAYDEDEVARKKKLSDEAIKISEERAKVNKAILVDVIEKTEEYQDAVNALNIQEREREIAKLKEAGNFTDALTASIALEEDANELKRTAMEAYFAEQEVLNKKAYNDSEQTAEDRNNYVKRFNAIIANEKVSSSLVQEELDKKLFNLRREYGLEERTWEEKLAEDRVKAGKEAIAIIENRIKVHSEMMKTFTAQTATYASAVQSLQDKETEAEVSRLTGIGNFTEAQALAVELEKDINARKVTAMEAYFAEQEVLNKKTYQDSEKTADDYNNYRLRKGAIIVQAIESGILLETDLQIELATLKKGFSKDELGYVKAKTDALSAELKALTENVAGYQKALDALDTAGMQKKIVDYKDKGEFTNAIAVEKQLTARAQQESLDNLVTFRDAQHAINAKEYTDGNRTYAEYLDQYALINTSAQSAINLINEQKRREDLLTEEEYLALKEEYWKEYTEAVVNSLLQSFNAVGDMIQAFATRELDALQLAHDRKMDFMQDELDEKLRIAGVAEETAVESAQRELEEAMASSDEKTINEKKNALKRAKIEEDYLEKMKKAEEDFAWKKAQLSYASAMTAWTFDAVSIASNAVVAMSKAIATLNPLIIAGTAVASGAQVAAHLATAPVAPSKSDYYGTGGMIKGTPEGTSIIAGEKNRTEVVSNPEQMANLLMAIGNGSMRGKDGMEITFIMKDVHDKEQARYVVQDVINKGVYLIDAQKGIKKVVK